MIKIIHVTDNNEYSEQVKKIWEELGGSLKRNYICRCYSCHTVFMQRTEDDCLPSEQLFSIFLHTFVHVWPHLLLAACCSNTFGSCGYLF